VFIRGQFSLLCALNLSAVPLDLTFWGVRGSVPTPVADNLGFGGNTACLTIGYADQPLLIFDAGTGIRALASTLADEAHFHLFLTHFHWDHIQGIPFFTPIQHPDCTATIHSNAEPADLERILAAQMRPPYYPIAMSGNLSYQLIDTPGTRIGDLLIRPFPLHHPNGATGYRIEATDATIVYASDHEHGDAAADATLHDYAHLADILIYDAQYTPAEYKHRRGWGHSTWREAVQLARSARVKQLILFHHDPSRTDQQLAQIVRDAQAEFEATIAAKEGWSIKL
jgi:phosphoribosyl 1,2-cyclic phosphodiesterase